jgi:hypothetical protein
VRRGAVGKGASAALRVSARRLARGIIPARVRSATSRPNGRTAARSEAEEAKGRGCAPPPAFEGQAKMTDTPRVRSLCDVRRYGI